MIFRFVVSFIGLHFSSLAVQLTCCYGGAGISAFRFSILLQANNFAGKVLKPSTKERNNVRDVQILCRIFLSYLFAILGFVCRISRALLDLSSSTFRGNKSLQGENNFNHTTTPKYPHLSSISTPSFRIYQLLSLGALHTLASGEKNNNPIFSNLKNSWLTLRELFPLIPL